MGDAGHSKSQGRNGTNLVVVLSGNNGCNLDSTLSSSCGSDSWISCIGVVLGVYILTSCLRWVISQTGGWKMFGGVVKYTDRLLYSDPS